METSIPGEFVEADIDASERRIVAGAVDGARVFDLVDGEWRPTAIEPSSFPRVRISPNGERVAVVGELPGGGRRALLLYNLRNGIWVDEGNFPARGRSYGYALSMDGTASRVFTSDPQSAQEGTRSGRGFVHTREASGVWRQTNNLTHPEPAALNYFGNGGEISLDGTVIVVVALRQNTGGIDEDELRALE